MSGGRNWRVTHPTEGRVYICPDCDHRAELYQRRDNSVKCYNCGHVVADRRHLSTRASKRQPRPEGASEPSATGTPGADPKYADLSPEDVGLSPMQD